MSQSINKRICAYRKSLRFTQAYVAEKLGIKTSTYSQKERCGKIDSESLIKIADLFEVDVRLLLYGSVQPAENKPDPNILELSNKERILLAIFRNLSPKQKQSVLDFAYQTFKQKLGRPLRHTS